MKRVKNFVMATLLLLTCLPQARALEPEEAKNPPTEQESPTLDFLEFARKRLNQGTENLDPDTRYKLLAMRNRALDIQKSKNWFPQWAPLPVMGLLTAILFIILVYAKPGSVPKLDTGLEDLEILASVDQLELYEDLEFYDWLANENYEAG